MEWFFITWSVCFPTNVVYSRDNVICLEFSQSGAPRLFKVHWPFCTGFVLPSGVDFHKGGSPPLSVCSLVHRQRTSIRKSSKFCVCLRMSETWRKQASLPLAFTSAFWDAPFKRSGGFWLCVCVYLCVLVVFFLFFYFYFYHLQVLSLKFVILILT